MSRTPFFIPCSPALHSPAPRSSAISYSSRWFLQMRFSFPLLTLILLPLADLPAQEKPTRNAPGFPGPTDVGAVLPNGWRVTPAGEQIILADLPLNIWTTPDGKHALVATNGYNAHELTAIDLATKQKVAAESAAQSW